MASGLPEEMRPGVTEEAKRVIKAMDTVEAMPDPEQRAKAISEVLADQAKRAKKWRDDRREVVLSMRAQKPPVSYRKIAAALGVSLRTVQDIETGYSGSGSHRPRVKDRAAKETPDDG
ncbi:helix-turn-helix domain-containing protein [Streptomyces sp. N2-109]|uniref:Helix-turn-helix domain-containing protein n=1 Tax=Streptomyces gossypii TaxID=2883101 RepID=A0ABT2JTE9_9ACTN|nr:helix-turn-helix domain-containing protein [Streptomyces gossypii]MCT2591121.1 helix-turn-helix domain-containing protein [Streptomyces gossypii]